MKAEINPLKTIVERQVWDERLAYKETKLERFMGADRVFHFL